MNLIGRNSNNKMLIEITEEEFHCIMFDINAAAIRSDEEGKKFITRERDNRWYEMYEIRKKFNEIEPF